MGSHLTSKHSQSSVFKNKYKIMKALLVIALAAVAYTKPGFYYHTGYPYAHVAYTHPVTYTAPVTYTVPVAANTCHNEAGQLVPCAHPAGGVVGNAIHAYNDSPLVPTVAVAGAPVAPAAEAAPAAEGEGVVDVKKREAEAAPEADADAEAYWYGYYGHPFAYRGYYGYWGHPFYRYGGVGRRNGYGSLVPCAGR